MKPIEHILEGILDDNFDVSETDINPLVQAFQSAKLIFDDRCEFTKDQWLELWRFISPIYYKKLAEQLGCKKIPKTKFVDTVNDGEIVGIWDYVSHEIIFYCSEYFYELGKRNPHLTQNTFKVLGSLIGYVSGSRPHATADYIKKHKCECYTIPYELMKKLMDAIKVPFEKK